MAKAAKTETPPLLATLAEQGWGEKELRREAVLIAAHPFQRAQFLALLAAIKPQ